MSGRSMRLIAAGGMVAAATVAFVVVRSDGPEEPSAVLRVLQGVVEVASPPNGFAPARDGMVIAGGDTVRTASDGRAALEFSDGSVTRLDARTEYTVRTLAVPEGGIDVAAEQTSGNSYHRVVRITGASSRFEVVVPTATVSVQGTAFAILIGDDGSITVAVYDGTVTIATATGVVTVPAGFLVVIGPDGRAGGPQPLPADLPEWVRYNRCDLDDEDTCPGDGPPPPEAIGRLEITPAAATVPAGTPQGFTVAAFDTVGIPFGDVTPWVTLAGPGCGAAVCTPTTAGSHPVTATLGDAVAEAVLTVIPGPATTITLGPDGATTEAGLPVAFVVVAFDTFGNTRGPVPAVVELDGGVCTGASCTSSVAGIHAVTARWAGLETATSLVVAPGPAAVLTVTPAAATVAANVPQQFTATALDAYGNSRGTVAAVFSIAGGRCDGPLCSSRIAGDHEVEAVFGGASGSATLTVVPGPLASIVIVPGAVSGFYPVEAEFSTLGLDAFGNSRGPVDADYSVPGDSNGYCEGAVCGLVGPGTIVVTAWFGGFTDTATITAY